jgi:hypothetical protein
MSGETSTADGHHGNSLQNATTDNLASNYQLPYQTLPSRWSNNRHLHAYRQVLVLTLLSVSATIWNHGVNFPIYSYSSEYAEGEMDAGQSSHGDSASIIGNSL